MESAAETVVALPWQDDAGARTADLFDWQAAMAAADGLRLVADAISDGGELNANPLTEIICEHHEDWTVLRGSEAELVSAKHREPASGAWTSIKQLISKGGVLHLFCRWMSLERKPSLRLVTCAALATGDCKTFGDVTRLLRDSEAGVELSQTDESRVLSTSQNLVKELMISRVESLPIEWQMEKDAVWCELAAADPRIATVKEFLSRLSIDEQRPPRTLIEHVAPTVYAKPILDRLERNDVPCAAVWEAVLNLFRVRMRAHGPMPDGMLPRVFATLPASQIATTRGDQDRELARRRITVGDIYIAIQSGLTNSQGYMPLAAPFQLSKLGIKMARGGCADTSIARAETMRADFKKYWRDRDSSLPGVAVERAGLERALLRIADEETANTRTPVGTWGAPLWSRVSNRLVDRSPDELLGEFDSDLALGGICDLAARCQVWFSPQFDVKAELARLRLDRKRAG
jgi:hypothetical protein